MEKKINFQKMISDCGKPEAVAEAIGVHYTSVYRWLKGQPPSVIYISKLLTEFDIDINDYVTGEKFGTNAQGENTSSTL